VSFVSTASKVDLPGVVEVRPAGTFTCARTADAKVYCWGDNSKGQLGRGTIGGAEPKPALVVWK
jgi:alpha-tubulin suppressor-like RCC1 family protein